MAEQVVEQVGFGQVIELVGAADPPGDGKLAMNQQVEKDVFVDQAFAGYQRPARQRPQAFAHLFQVGNAIGRQAQGVQAGQVARVRTSVQEGTLAAQ